MEMANICDECDHNSVCGFQDDTTLACTHFSKKVAHARWVELGSDDTDDLRWMCSNCKEVWFYSPVRNNYCPNCGAKMDGERKDNND